MANHTDNSDFHATGDTPVDGSPSLPDGSSPTDAHVAVTDSANATDITGTTSTEASAMADIPAASSRKDTSVSEPRKVERSNAGTMWTGLIIGALLLVLLLVFILQNQEPATLNFFGWRAEFPTGVGMLIAAVIGALIMAAVGGTRIIQLRRQITQS